MILTRRSIRPWTGVQVAPLTKNPYCYVESSKLQPTPVKIWYHFDHLITSYSAWHYFCSFQNNEKIRFLCVVGFLMKKTPFKHSKVLWQFKPIIINVVVQLTSWRYQKVVLHVGIRKEKCYFTVWAWNAHRIGQTWGPSTSTSLQIKRGCSRQKI